MIEDNNRILYQIQEAFSQQGNIQKRSSLKEEMILVEEKDDFSDIHRLINE